MGAMDGLLTALAGGVVGGANAYSQDLVADMQQQRQIQAQRDVLAAQLQARIDEANNSDLQNAMAANMPVRLRRGSRLCTRRKLWVCKTRRWRRRFRSRRYWAPARTIWACGAGTIRLAGRCFNRPIMDAR